MMKLLITQFSSVPYYFYPLVPEVLPQQTFYQHLQCMLPLNVRHHVS